MPVGSFNTNCYILYHDDTKRGIIIDPGGDADLVLARVKAYDLKIHAILLTHGHFDHIAAANEVATQLDVKIYASKQDAALAADPQLNGSRLLMHKDVICNVDKFLDDREYADFGWIKLRALLTPGHTAGHICYYAKQLNLLFSGDLLFKGSYGRYDLPTSNFDDLKNSLQRLFALPPETEVYPGHGNPTAIGYEKEYNPINRG